MNASTVALVLTTMLGMTAAQTEPSTSSHDDEVAAANEAIAEAEPSTARRGDERAAVAPARPDPAPASASAGPTPSSGAVVTASLDEGLGIHDAQRRFGMKLGFFGQLRAGWVEQRGGHELGMSLPVARPILTANLWGTRVRARLMPELAGATPKLLDATATVRVHEAFSVQLGQYRPWLSRGYRTGLPVQALVDRGPLVDAFRIGRDVGVTVLGRPWSGRFEYYLGVMNGRGSGSVQATSLPLLTARVVVAPRGAVAYSQTPYLDASQGVRIAMGASGYAVQREPDESSDPSYREYGASTDAVLSTRWIHAQLEGFTRITSARGEAARRELGGYAQLSGLVVRDRLDLALRVGAIESERWQVPLESGLGIYLARNHAKLQLRYACALVPTRSGCASQSAAVQAQLRF